MSADYSFKLNSIETYAPQFFVRNDLFLSIVKWVLRCLLRSLFITEMGTTRVIYWTVLTRKPLEERACIEPMSHRYVT